MLSNNLNKELNDQITYEFFSSHLYLAMSAELQKINFPGASHYMIIQAEEERFHAMKIFNFIIENGGIVEIKGLDTPKIKSNTLEGIFKEAFEHEKKVTCRINKIMDIAQKEKNYSAINILNWFIDEQVEEENTADNYIKKIKLINNDGNGLYQLDKEFSSRLLNVQE